MELVFENNLLKNPAVSIVLIDWSVRESFHSLEYLNNQTIPREEYEIIWIEYYSRRSPEIKAGLEEYIRLGRPPILDKWIVIDIPDNVYYHKHLMYNIGIVVSKSPIITFMDSDAVVRPTFVESTIKSFENDGDIVLHMDQVRNINKKFYPFNYPSVNEITGEGCINLLNGKPMGLVDNSDPLHLRNYGACMTTMRDHLINIGGADEHIDYLGHICGPYDMTFRLVNAGKKEVWHQEEFLYHTWHPGTDGRDNYLGPHDGRNMSQTALSSRRTRRILPLVENLAIRSIRQKEHVPYDDLLPMAVSEANLKEWMIDKQSSIEDKRTVYRVSMSKNPLFVIRYYWILIKLLISCVYVKIPYIKEILKGFLGASKKKVETEPAVVFANSSIKIDGVADLVRRSFKFPVYLLNLQGYYIERCRQCLNDLMTMGNHEVAIFGSGIIVQALCLHSQSVPIKIAAIYDNPVIRKKFMGHTVLPIEDIENYKGKIIIASFDDAAERNEILIKYGVTRDAIMDLW